MNSSTRKSCTSSRQGFACFVPGVTRLFLLLLVALALAGCGGEDDSAEPAAKETAPAETMKKEGDTMKKEGESMSGDAAMLARRPSGEAGLRVPAKRARIVAKSSSFGRVLFDANGQVVYVFENDSKNRSACTSAECVTAWPPVLTRQEPTAGAGIEDSLLGTIRRADGMLQVTYNGRPLYFYEHEGPGEVKCHNVDLHGGLWWVVTPRGEPAT
jgi:predicted lipoprotein with Yx(FWY)xxD motif